MNTHFRIYLLAAGLLCGGGLAFGQPPQLVSTTPANGAGGVGVTTPIIFTFNQPMNTEVTSAYFIDMSNPMGQILVTDSWNTQGTVLTCTPDVGWPGNKTIWWSLDGENPAGEMLNNALGSFSTGGQSGGGGSGTNQITSFDVGKGHIYVQASTALPVLDPEVPYIFFGGLSLASNRTATLVSVKFPTGVVTNLSPSFMHPEDYAMIDFQTNLSTFEGLYPQGDYTFTVQAATSNQTVKVTLPTTMQQPNAPHISNYPQTQAIDPTKPFTLTWDPFQGGTASDYIFVIIGDRWKTTEPGGTNFLPATATSATIPAGVLSLNTNYPSTIHFYRLLANTNAVQATIAYRYTATQITLVTTGGGSAGGTLAIENVSQTGSQFTFESTATAGQTITLQTSSTLQPNSWVNLYTTNSPGTRVRFAVPMGSQPGANLFRLKNGS